MKIPYEKLIIKNILSYPWHIKNKYNWNMLKELQTEEELKKIQNGWSLYKIKKQIKGDL